MIASKAIILQKLIRKTFQKDDDEVDFEHLYGLIQKGADINTCDIYGQTVLHEVAREWHVDVAKACVQKNNKLIIHR